MQFVFSGQLSAEEEDNLCTLIYYPQEKLERMRQHGQIHPEWYRLTLKALITLAAYMSSKYTRSKVRKALPEDFAYIIDELMHAQKDEDNNRQIYHEKILDSIIETGSADAFIEALSTLIKRLAVDRLHVVGDIFDRGDQAHKIMDVLIDYHDLDIQWGNHDILWMGAACGSDACIANVVRNNIKYDNLTILERGYGISLRELILFAQKTYPQMEPAASVVQAITVILLKLEGQAILRNPDFQMENRLLLEKIDMEHKTVEAEGVTWPLKMWDFPTLDPQHPYDLTPEEQIVVDELHASFIGSERLKRDVDFLYEKGSIYKCCNGNLLFHGCIPLDESGNFQAIKLNGKMYKGRELFDFADAAARRAYYGGEDQKNQDFMWYLWGGRRSPLCGRNLKTFERSYIADKASWSEEKDAYYSWYKSAKTAEMILHEFGLYSPHAHIINGHTPIKAVEGEDPIRAGGKVIVIDGGLCKAYRKTTGIAGYTLIYNSHGMRLKEHQPFESIEKALEENMDIESSSLSFETEPTRVMISDTDEGIEIAERIRDLELLLTMYREGIMVEKTS